MARWLKVLAAVFLLAAAATAARKSPPKAEPQIEEVTAKQLERVLEEKDFVAVYWYARSCVTCDKVLEELEKIDDDTDTFGVDFVKINDKRLAKQYGITKFPALTYFREKEPIIYDGDLMDEESVLDFLTSLEAMDLPDRIEEVNQKILSKIIEDTDYVAVLFYKPECKKCAKALQELENIDDEADQLGIGFVKIHDEELAEEYSLGELPRLVYYRHEIPIIYESELSKEEDVLEWLIANKSTGDEEDVIEDVTAKTLNTLIGNVDNLVVVFYDHGDDESMTVLGELENIDDDCDRHGIQFVKIDDTKAAESFGIDNIPSIVYFEKQIPNVYDGDLENEEEILEWLVGQLEKDEIEDVTDEMLDKLIKDGKTVAVLFYDNNDRKSQKVLAELENIDDECDTLGIAFVKIDNDEEAKEYGIEKIPTLLYFEKGIPTYYEGNLEEEEKVLAWLRYQAESDEIEDITDEMLDLIIEKMPYVAVLFYDKDQKKSQKILAELENIDDECDQNDIAFVKIDDDKEAKEYGIESIPTMVLFEKGIPHIYEGDLMKEDDLLGWLLHQKRHSEIPEVTDEMMDKLIENTPYLAVIFYDKDDKQDIRILNELENIDDELEKEGIVIVRMDNENEAKEFGIDHLPTLVYFEENIPAIYDGDLMNEDEVLEWLIEQKNSATIEEVTDEILTDLIEEHEYVVVYFSGNCEEGEECDNILDELENIDDELDETGIIFVTTEDLSLAKKYGIKTFPTLVFFRNKDPLIYKGDIEDEDEVLSWLTDEDTLEIPGKIEEVNSRMLEKILEENDHVVVFFYKEGDKKSQKVLSELENIDDECEEKDIDFVKISDEGVEKEYDLSELPALAFYRHKFRTIYEGDLMHEEDILAWVLDLVDSQPDVIESVDRKTLKDLITDVEHLAVFFYSEDCDTCDEVLEELETIDDDTDKHGIQFVKSKDSKLASDIGIFSFPALVYYETGVPIMYDGDLKNEKKVLQWLVDQKSEDSNKHKNKANTKSKANADGGKTSGFGGNADVDTSKRVKPAEWKTMGTLRVRFPGTNDPKSKRREEGKVKPKIDDNDDDDNDDDDDDDDEDDDDDNNDDDDDDDGDDDDDDDDDNDEEDSDNEYDDDDGDDDDNSDDDEDDDNDSNDVKSKGTKLKELLKLRKNKEATWKTVGKLRIRIPGNKKAEKDDDDDDDEGGDDDNDDDNDNDDVVGDDNDDDEHDKNNYKANSISSKYRNNNPGLNKHVQTKKNSVKSKPDDNNEDHDNDDDDNNYDDYDKDNLRNKRSKNISSKNKVLYERRRQNNYDNDDDNDNDDEDDDDDNDDKDDDDNGDSDNDDDDGDAQVKTMRKKRGSDYGHKSRIQYKKTSLRKNYQDDNDDDDGNNDDDDDDNNDDDDDDDADEDDHGDDDDDDDDDDNDDDDEDDDDDDDDDEDDDGEDDSFFGRIKRMFTGDRCFYIGLGAKPAAPKLTYEPYQCCPTKVQSPTKVAKATPTKVPAKKLDKEIPKQQAKPAKGSKALAKPEKGKGKKGNLLDESEVLDWMVKQKEDESIEHIEREKLLKYIETKEFLAVVFYKEEDPESPRILRYVELIDDEASEYGIKVVKCSDRLMAKKYGFRNPPGITYFRKGKYINYDGDMDDEEEILDWLTNPENMELTDHIEKVNRKMFQKIRQTSDYVAVFFYSNDCKQCPRVLMEIEHIDDDADGAGINFVKIDDKQMAKELGVFALPAVLFFKMGSKDPVIYAGDLYDEQQLLSWLLTQKNPSGDVIEALEGKDLTKLIEEEGSLAVYFWNKTLCEMCNSKAMRKSQKKKEKEPDDEEAAEEDSIDCEQCAGILEELENIDDDCDRHNIKFVKTQDYAIAESYGVTDFPVLVYFESNIPNVYEGSLAEEEEVLQWLITQKTEDRIELITRVMLENMVEDTQYLAVYFYKLNCHICDHILEGLEQIDDECDVYGIHMVKIQDPQLAKRYSIKTFPAMVYFRNGNPLLFEGDLQNEESILEWLIDDDNRELADEIESVNERMLERLLIESHLLVVFFYDDEDCQECEDLLESLEQIDGEVDQFGIDFVKIASPEAAAKYNVINIPSLVYFRKQVPMLYDGDIHQVEKVLSWLTSQDVFEIKNEIEEVNRKMLDKLLEENEFLAVYFYEKSAESRAVLDKLENIDSETDNLDITFVKMEDPRYARKWGVTKLPAIVYFRKRFPSIYRGDTMNEDEVLDWLRKNRFRQPELNIFMYALIALSIAFVMYTAFLLQCFKPAPPVPTPHPKQA